MVSHFSISLFVGPLPLNHGSKAPCTTPCTQFMRRPRALKPPLPVSATLLRNHRVHTRRDPDSFAPGAVGCPRSRTVPANSLPASLVKCRTKLLFESEKS